jgi:sugar/nucleoside kinase (ribokinase family)
MPNPTVTFGEIMLRLAPPGMERFLQSPQFVATFGGGEANVAVALASFGWPARYVTVVPAGNPIAEACVAELRRFGVDTAHMVRGKGRLGIYYLEPGANQRPSKVFTTAPTAPSRSPNPATSIGTPPSTAPPGCTSRASPPPSAHRPPTWRSNPSVAPATKASPSPAT